MAIDWGERRIGLAISDPSGIIATPAGVIVRKVLSGRRIVCAAPAYIARHGAPRVPQDLHAHRCITIGDSRLLQLVVHAEPSAGAPS